MEKTKILIVDDRQENLTALSELISSDEIEIHSALNAEEALNHLLEHEFALALLDVQMPGVSGFELARLIRGVRKSKHLPVIFVTAQQQSREIIFEGYDSGAVDLLFKPLEPHIVRSKVKAFVKLDQQSELLRIQMEEVRCLRKRADDANMAKSQFLANMSHEIRTPLASVMGFADVLSQTELSEPERLGCLSAIRRNGELLLRLIDDILDLSKIEAHQLKLEKTEFILDDLLNDVESTLASRASQKGIHLQMDRLSEKNLRYLSDPIRLKQILLNVLGNAIKFTEKGSVSLRVHVDNKFNDIKAPQKQRVVFEVHDTGVGMTSDETKKLFQPFSQADVSNSRRFGGTGLGLVISRQLAQSLGGDLKLLETEFGKGSLFEISVLVDKILPATEKNPRLDSAEAIAGALKGKTVLVVDDVSDNRVLIERYMKNSEAMVLQAASGIEALELLQRETPDLILMDIQMPLMDGYQATQQIRALGYTKPIIALTAHAMKDEISKCLECGCNDVLTKPAKRKELVALLTEIILHPEREWDARSFRKI